MEVDGYEMWRDRIMEERKNCIYKQDNWYCVKYEGKCYHEGKCQFFKVKESEEVLCQQN